MKIQIIYFYNFMNFFVKKLAQNVLMIKLKDNNDIYYFQVSKLRDALNHLILLEPSIKEIIDDNILKELSVNNFFNLYNPENFDINKINEEISRFLFDLNYEEY